MWCEPVLDFIQGNVMLEIPKGYDFAESNMSDDLEAGTLSAELECRSFMIPVHFQMGTFLILFLEYNPC